MTGRGRNFDQKQKLLTIRNEEQEGEVLALDEEIKTTKIKLATLLGVMELLVCFCSKCLVSEFHRSHVLEETDEGTVYRYVFLLLCLEGRVDSLVCWLIGWLVGLVRLEGGSVGTSVIRN